MAGESPLATGAALLSKPELVDCRTLTRRYEDVVAILPNGNVEVLTDPDCWDAVAWGSLSPIPSWKQ